MSAIKQIEAIIIDCDGTLTSGGVTYSESGERQKTFHSRDIPAIKKLVGFGFRVMIVSQSKWQGVKYFAERCGCEYYTGVADKLEFVQKMGIDPGSCIVFTDSTDDCEIVGASYGAYAPKDGNFHALSNARTLDVNGGCGVVDYFINQCCIRHVSGRGHNEMVMDFGHDEFTPMPPAKKREQCNNDYADALSYMQFPFPRPKAGVYSSFLDFVKGINKQSDETGDSEKIKRLYLGLDDPPYPNYAKGGIDHAEPDPHDFCANAATAKTCKSTADQLAQRAKQEVHALKNLAVLEGDETADKKAGRIYDLIDQIVVCGVSEKRYGNSCIPDPNAQHLDLAELPEITQLRKENAELKDWSDKLNECCNLLESEVQMLKAKIYDIQNKEK